MASPTTDGSSGQADRDRHIPVRKTDILAALIERASLRTEERDTFRAFGRLLGAIEHGRFFGELEKLRDDYHYFNPEIEARHVDPAQLDAAHAELVTTLKTVLTQANFVPVPLDEITRARKEHYLLRVAVETPMETYREVLCFRLGHRIESIEVRERFGLRRRKVNVTVYDRVALLVMIRPASELNDRQLSRLARNGLRPGSILIKYFRQVASPDLDMLFPDARVVMTLFDKLKLALPAIAGGVPILLKLPALTVLFAVAGFYLGLRGAVGDEDQTAALAALSVLAALGGFLLQQWIRYQAQSLKYHKAIADNIYFRNLNNNAGLFDYLIGAAEEQDVKESLLAYAVLQSARAPLDRALLQAAVEAWLRETFSVDIAFEVDDALAKLDRLGLLCRVEGGFAVLPLDQALARLNQVWCEFLPAPATVA